MQQVNDCPLYLFFSCIVSSEHQGTRAGPVQDESGAFFSVVVVDARDNNPPSTGTPKAALPAPRRNKKQPGGAAVAVSVGDQRKKVTEQA